MRPDPRPLLPKPPLARSLKKVVYTGLPRAREFGDRKGVQSCREARTCRNNWLKSPLWEIMTALAKIFLKHVDPIPKWR
jgi:hypothetical protein